MKPPSNPGRFSLNHATTYAYDALNRKISMADALSRTTRYSYDAAGNMTSQLDPTGRVTSYGYDSGSHLISIQYSDGTTPNVTYSYDVVGHRTGMLDGSGSSTYGYDSLGRLTQSTDGASSQLRYGYDLKGQLTSIVYPGGVNTVSRTYDDAGRLHTVQDWLSHTTTFKLDANSNLFEQDYPNSTIAALTYNAADQLTGITDSFSGTPFLSFVYGRDNVGQLTSDTPKSYGYDANSRLQTVTNVATTTYAHDNADRLTSASISGGGNTTTQVYDLANQIQSLTVTNEVTQIAKTTYGFDADGNRTSAAIQGGATTSNGYDQADRLVAFGAGATYQYNGSGLRVSKTVAGTTEAFAWDVADGLPLNVRDGGTSYVTGLGGLSLEQVTGSTVYYFHQDQLGSTRALTDGAGAVQQTYEYDPYGNLSAGSGSLVNPFQYGGQQFDAESGYYYLRARYYDPATAQFITRDPMVESTRAAYSYVGGSPLDRGDPSGLDFWDGVQSGGIWIGQHLSGGIRQGYVNALSAAGNRAGDDYTRLHSGDPAQMVQPVFDAVTIAATVTGIWGAGRALVGCGLRLLASEGASGLGDLSVAEVKQIQGVVDSAGRPLDVVGSAARSARGPASDIDYTAASSSHENFWPHEDQLPGLDQHGILHGPPDPFEGPSIRFEPGADPFGLNAR